MALTDKLTDIADAIRLKRDIVTPLSLEDMALQVSLIDGGGGTEENEMELISEGKVADVLYPTYATATADTKQYQHMVFDFGGDVWDEFELYIVNSSATALAQNSSGTKVDTASLTLEAVNYAPNQWSGGAVFAGGVWKYTNSAHAFSMVPFFVGTWNATYVFSKFLADGRNMIRLKATNAQSFEDNRIMDDRSRSQYWNYTNGYTGAIALEINQYFNPDTVATYKLYGRRRKTN